jgi:hypothetical protein
MHKLPFDSPSRASLLGLKERINQLELPRYMRCFSNNLLVGRGDQAITQAGGYRFRTKFHLHKWINKSRLK